MVKDDARFPDNISEGVLKRMFSPKNVSRILKKARKGRRESEEIRTLFRKKKQGGDSSICVQRFGSILYRKLQLWSKFDPSLPTQWSSIEPRLPSLFSLFEAVQALGGWRSVLGMSHWRRLECDLHHPNARSDYENYLSCLDWTLHPTSKTPDFEYFPPGKLKNWAEVMSLRVPRSDADLQHTMALEMCVFREGFGSNAMEVEVGLPATPTCGSLSTWASNSLLLTPIPQTFFTVSLSKEAKVIHNARSLGVPLLVLNTGSTACSVIVHPESISTPSLHPDQRKRFFVMQNPGDVLLVQGLHCLTLTAKDTTVTRLSCLPRTGSRLVALMERAELSALVETEVPFPTYFLICDLMQMAKLALTREEQYQVAMKLMEQADDWEGEDLPPCSLSICHQCRKELFLTGWQCDCHSVFCRPCSLVTITQRHTCEKRSLTRVCTNPEIDCGRVLHALQRDVREFIDRLPVSSPVRTNGDLQETEAV